MFDKECCINYCHNKSGRESDYCVGHQNDGYDSLLNERDTLKEALRLACEWGMLGANCNHKIYYNQEGIGYKCPEDKVCPECWTNHFIEQAKNSRGTSAAKDTKEV